jgi:hypothetical protein
VVIDPTDPPNAPQRRSLVGNLWTDPNGKLWLFFDQSLGYFDGRSGGPTIGGRGFSRAMTLSKRGASRSKCRVV